MNKKNKKEDREVLSIVLMILIIGGVIAMFIIFEIIDVTIKYKFSKNGEVHESNECFVEKQVAWCKYEGNYIVVDDYYGIK